MEKPTLDLNSARFATMSEVERADALFNDRFRIIGNLSHWAEQNPQQYQRLRSLAKQSARLDDNQREELQAQHAKLTDPAPEVDPVELLKAVTQFPKERCQRLFTKPSDEPGESSSTLSPEDYKLAKMAAIHFDVITPQTSATVRFNYKRGDEYRRDAQAAKEATGMAEATRRNAGVAPSDLPPGLTRNERGELAVTDGKAFSEWKARKQAIQELEAAAK